MHGHTANRLRSAFEKLAELAGLDERDRVVSLLLVGGAGGMLAGYLPETRVTEDCDVMVWAPADAWQRLAGVAGDVALQFDLASNWLNNGAQVFEHRLLPGWENRRATILSVRGIEVHVPARVDYIALKLLAGRDVDLDDVVYMGITADEYTHIRREFDAWPDSHFASATIPVARERLDAAYHQETIR